MPNFFTCPSSEEKVGHLLFTMNNKKNSKYKKSPASAGLLAKQK